MLSVGLKVVGGVLRPVLNGQFVFHRRRVSTYKTRGAARPVVRPAGEMTAVRGLRSRWPR